jgi:serine/threonine-protein kinase
MRAPDLSGCTLDERYELHAVIGEGAFGCVYHGFDNRLGRAVAVKVIKPWWAQDSVWVGRFPALHVARAGPRPTRGLDDGCV